MTRLPVSRSLLALSLAAMAIGQAQACNPKTGKNCAAYVGFKSDPKVKAGKLAPAGNVGASISTNAVVQLGLADTASPVPAPDPVAASDIGTPDTWYYLPPKSPRDAGRPQRPVSYQTLVNTQNVAMQQHTSATHLVNPDGSLSQRMLDQGWIRMQPVQAAVTPLVPSTMATPIATPSPQQIVAPHLAPQPQNTPGPVAPGRVPPTQQIVAPHLAPQPQNTPGPVAPGRVPPTTQGVVAPPLAPQTVPGLAVVQAPTPDPIVAPHLAPQPQNTPGPVAPGRVPPTQQVVAPAMVTPPQPPSTPQQIAQTSPQAVFRPADMPLRPNQYFVANKGHTVEANSGAAQRNPSITNPDGTLTPHAVALGWTMIAHSPVAPPLAPQVVPGLAVVQAPTPDSIVAPHLAPQPQNTPGPVAPGRVPPTTQALVAPPLAPQAVPGQAVAQGPTPQQIVAPRLAPQPQNTPGPVAPGRLPPTAQGIVAPPLAPQAVPGQAVVQGPTPQQIVAPHLAPQPQNTPGPVAPGRLPPTAQGIVAPPLAPQAVPGQAVVQGPTPQPVIAPPLATPGQSVTGPSASGIAGNAPQRARPDRPVEVYHASNGGTYRYSDARQTWDPAFHFIVIGFKEPE